MALPSPSPDGLCVPLEHCCPCKLLQTPWDRRGFPGTEAIINCFSILGAPNPLSEDVPFSASLMPREFSPIPTTQRHLRYDGTVDIYVPQVCTGSCKETFQGIRNLRCAGDPNFRPTSGSSPPFPRNSSHNSPH